jgi:SPP1 family predicted phage head-tail adaptor
MQLLFRDVIRLIKFAPGENALGDSIKNKIIGSEISADKKSIRQNEFYQAAAAGLRPELMFEIRTIEYNEEPVLQYNGREYNILRTYEKDSEFIELVCQGVVNNATT